MKNLKDEQRLTKIYKAIDLQKQVLGILKDPDLVENLERLCAENPQVEKDIEELFNQMDRCHEKDV